MDSKLSVFVVEAPCVVGVEEFFFVDWFAAQTFCVKHDLSTDCIVEYSLYSAGEVDFIDYSKS